MFLLMVCCENSNAFIHVHLCLAYSFFPLLLQLTVDGEVVEVRRLFSDELTLSELKVGISSLDTANRGISSG